MTVHRLHEQRQVEQPALRSPGADAGVRHKYCQYEREFNLQNDEEYLQKMVDAGLQVYYPTEEQAQQFVDATAGVEDLIRAKVGDELVDAYKVLLPPPRQSNNDFD